MTSIATRKQMAELDRLMVVRYGVSIIQMMELAGLATAKLAMKISKGKKILVLCGHGNNGGDGLCAARHLINFGYDIAVVIAKEKLGEAAAYQKEILEKMNIEIMPASIDFSKYNLIVDALIGFNLQGTPKEPYASIIRKANSAKVPILSVDMPSGLDADEGKIAEPCVRAAYTLALSAVKKGCKKSKEFCGEIYLGYIGVPSELYEELKIKKPAFAGL